MSEPVRKRSSPLLTALFVVVLLAIAYPLSLGPAAWFYNHGYVPESLRNVVESVYSPILWIDEDADLLNSNIVGRMYRDYLDWWDRP